MFFKRNKKIEKMEEMFKYNNLYPCYEYFLEKIDEILSSENLVDERNIRNNYLFEYKTNDELEIRICLFDHNQNPIIVIYYGGEKSSRNLLRTLIDVDGEIIDADLKNLPTVVQMMDKVKQIFSQIRFLNLDIDDIEKLSTKDKLRFNAEQNRFKKVLNENECG